MICGHKSVSHILFHWIYRLFSASLYPIRHQYYWNLFDYIPYASRLWCGYAIVFLKLAGEEYQRTVAGPPERVLKVCGIHTSSIYIFFLKLHKINYNDLTATSRNHGIMVDKGNHPKMALFLVSEILWFTQIYVCFY